MRQLDLAAIPFYNKNCVSFLFITSIDDDNYLFQLTENSAIVEIFRAGGGEGIALVVSDVITHR